MRKYILLSTLAFSGIAGIANASTPAHHAIYQDGKIIHPKVAMADADVKALVKTMQGKANDAEKLVVFKDSLKTKGIMIAQLFLLLNQLNEEPKLDAAIYAFQYTVDYKKYEDVQNVFNEEINKRRLLIYLDKHRKNG